MRFFSIENKLQNLKYKFQIKLNFQKFNSKNKKVQ
jgi:hypothetical protein